MRKWYTEPEYSTDLTHPNYANYHGSHLELFESDMFYGFPWEEGSAMAAFLSEMYYETVNLNIWKRKVLFCQSQGHVEHVLWKQYVK